jgi:predicted amidohydrolase
MGLEPLLPHTTQAPLEAVAELFWQELFPTLRDRLSRPGKAVVLGTVPARSDSGSIRNRAPILAEGVLSYQDKLHLTPWENAFECGDTLKIWHFAGFRITVIICLDIEIPELSARLRDSQVDLILCPSATETELGVERVNRCASARAVELGCYCAVSHLTGTATSDLIDVNLGKAALYRPSQAAFKNNHRTEATEIFTEGCHQLRVTLDKHPLNVMRRMFSETNPAHLGTKNAGWERVIRLESTP